MTQIETPRPMPAAEPLSKRGLTLLSKSLIRGAILILIAGVGLFLFLEVRTLWQEYHLLQEDIATVNHTAVVGYPGIAPKVTFAQRPRAWYREEGQTVLLWAGWIDGKGHRWYRAAPGDVDPSGLLIPHPVAISRAIDHPKIETGDGRIWRAMPDDVMVVGQTLAGRKCVYPLPVLLKVEVVNDVVEERPFLVTANLLATQEKAFVIFDANLDGHRVTMSPSGYYQSRKPLLYDRGTESLWVEKENSLTAIAGTHKGKKLARVARPVPVAWQSWRKSNPRSRLVTGGDRTLGIPTE